MFPRTHSSLGTTIASWPGLLGAVLNKKPTVLLAEDDLGVSNMICALLATYNFDVKATASGIEALHLARSWLPDIVVLDINLPEMTGLEICRALKADPRTCVMPVVFCSGEGHLAGEAMALGAAAFLEKPDGVLKLGSCLRETLALDSQIAWS